MRTICSLRIGATRAGEKNDCTVRALANVTGLSYDECHARMKEAGRKDCTGADAEYYFDVYMQSGAKQGYVVGKTNKALWIRRIFPDYKHIKGMTVRTLVEELQDKRGRYIAVTEGHALAIVDGFIIDKFNNPANKRVVALFRF